MTRSQDHAPAGRKSEFRGVVVQMLHVDRAEEVVGFVLGIGRATLHEPSVAVRDGRVPQGFEGHQVARLRQRDADHCVRSRQRRLGREALTRLGLSG